MDVSDGSSTAGRGRDGAIPAGDYVSPGLATIRLDEAFPEMVVGNPDDSTWPYLHRGKGHNWYVDRRNPTVGFVNRDEASLLYNNAMLFAGRPCLEIGCWRGWSAAHIAAGSGSLDVIDPALQDPAFLADVQRSLSRAGVGDRVRLPPGASPEAVDRLADMAAKRWSFVFIDGDHEGAAPRRDAEVVVRHVAETAMVMFHDLLAPSVMAGFDFLRAQGWNTRVYRTMQVMGVAWRGDVEPVRHCPDPAMDWSMPAQVRDDAVVAPPGPAKPIVDPTAGPPGDALQRLLGKHAELLERLAAAELRPPAPVPADELDRLHSRLLVGLERLTVLSAERERDSASLAALTASSAAQEAEGAALRAEHAKALEQGEQLRAALGHAAQDTAQLTEQLEAARSEAGAHASAFADLHAKHEDLLKLAERLQAKQAQLVSQLAVQSEPPPAEPVVVERPPIVIAPVERPPVVMQAPARQGRAIARTMARPRVVIGLMRRGMASRAAARNKAALIARQHGVADQPAFALAEWMLRPRNALGLLRRSVMGNQAGAERAVLAKLDDAYMRAASQLVQPGGEAYESLATALEQKMVQLASLGSGHRPSSAELDRLRAEFQDQARRHEHDRTVLSQLEAAKVADENALLELRIELATARAQTRKVA